jgi:hypothetical protein
MAHVIVIHFQICELELWLLLAVWAQGRILHSEQR